jgi:hypothetical protein
MSLKIQFLHFTIGFIPTKSRYSSFAKILLLWEKSTKGSGALTCCEIAVGVLAVMRSRIITNVSHRLKKYKKYEIL